MSTRKKNKSKRKIKRAGSKTLRALKPANTTVRKDREAAKLVAPQEPMTVFPFKPRDWVADRNGRVARVRTVYEGYPGEVLLDLILHDRDGSVTGRESPHMGGPRTFEPACSSEGWQRISEPTFPISLRWVTDGKGKKTAQWWAGNPLPPARWRKPVRRARGGLFTAIINDRYRDVLEQIADGHNDARSLAAETLGRKTV